MSPLGEEDPEIDEALDEIQDALARLVWKQGRFLHDPLHHLVEVKAGCDEECPQGRSEDVEIDEVARGGIEEHGTVVHVDPTHIAGDPERHLCIVRRYRFGVEPSATLDT